MTSPIAPTGPGSDAWGYTGSCNPRQSRKCFCLKVRKGFPGGERLLRHRILQKTQWKEYTLLTLRNKSLGEVGREKEKEMFSTYSGKLYYSRVMVAPNSNPDDLRRKGTS